MTDEQIQKEGQCRECCGPLALDGNCYNSECVLRVATDNTIPLADAVRAYRDRPSMEAELEYLRGVEYRFNCLLCNLTDGKMSKTNYEVSTMEHEIEDCFTSHYEDEVRERESELSALRAKCQRYEAALRRLDEWGVDDTDKWNQEHPNEEGLYLFDAEAMCAFAEWALNKEEK